MKCTVIGAEVKQYGSATHGGWHHGGNVCERERSHDETGSQSDSGAILTLSYYNFLSWELTGIPEELNSSLLKAVPP